MSTKKEVLIGRRSGFSGLRSKSGEWIVIKNKKKRNWQKIETKPPIPMMHTLFNSHSSSSEDLEGAENENEQNNENEEDEDDEDDADRGGEGDDEIENENENENEDEQDASFRTRHSGKLIRNVPLSAKGPPSSIIRIQPNPHPPPLPSSPLLSFPPGFVPRSNQTIKPHPTQPPQQQGGVNTRNSNSLGGGPGYPIIDNRTVPSFEKKSVSGTKQSEKISTVGFCRYFLQGYCRDGKRCVFSHDAAQLKRTQSEPLSIDNSSRPSEAPAPATTSTPTGPKPIYRSHSSEMSQHIRPVHNPSMDQDGPGPSSAFHVEPPIQMMEELRIPPPFSSPSASTISDTSSERSRMSLFPASASASPFMIPSPSIPIPFPQLLNGGTYSASNPTSPFASSMSPESLGGLSTFRLNSSYSHVTARDLSEKTISRSLSRPSSFDSLGASSPFDNRSRSLTSTTETSSWVASSHFPSSAPSHFYAYDTPLRGNSSESIILSSVSKPEPSFAPSAFLSTPSSLPPPMGSPVLSSSASINPLPREDPVKFEEHEDDAKHADLDLKLVECDGPDSILLDQHSADEIEPENNLAAVRDSRAGSGEFSLSSPSVSPFDPHLITSAFVKIPPSHDLSDPLQLNASRSSGEESHSENSSPQQLPSRSLLIPSELSIAEDHDNEEGAEEEQANGEPTDPSPLPSSKPIPIPGSSASYSSIVRASSSPILTSSSAPLMTTKKASPAIPSSGPLKKDDVKSILPVAALSDKKGRKVCSFFLQGICRYGQQCRHRHLHCVSDKCLSCGQTVGSTVEEQQVHLTLCTEVMAMEKERKESASRKCGICHQLTLKLNRKFGLLISCNHSFCLQCIREWRGSSEHSRERVRACPICKVISHYVIPCDRHVAEPSRKQRVIVEYKWRLGQIDCKHYNRGKAICPFGEACFYRHEDGPPKSKATRRPKTYNENIFEDDEDEDEEDESDTIENPKNLHHESEGRNNSSHTTTAPTTSTSSSTDSGLPSRDRESRPSSFTVLKFAKKKIPAGINGGGGGLGGGPNKNNNHKMGDPKKNNSGKYIKGKSKNNKK